MANLLPERRMGTTRTTAALCDVSPATIFRWIADPTLEPAFPRAVQLGTSEKSKRFDLDEVQAWIEARKVLSAAQPSSIDERRQRMRDLRARRTRREAARNRDASQA
jgi:predicted DNA-binding transcriptional regulator AlpA